MNDIFKIFKKKCQSGKSGLRVIDIIKDLNEKEQDEIIASEVVANRFDRKNYLSISKSGRLKSKRPQNESRALKEDLFNQQMRAVIPPAVSDHHIHNNNQHAHTSANEVTRASSSSSKLMHLNNHKQKYQSCFLSSSSSSEVDCSSLRSSLDDFENQK